jgi:hypothetical protein
VNGNQSPSQQAPQSEVDYMTARNYVVQTFNSSTQLSAPPKEESYPGSRAPAGASDNSQIPALVFDGTEQQTSYNEASQGVQPQVSPAPATPSGSSANKIDALYMSPSNIDDFLNNDLSLTKTPDQLNP